MLKYDKTLKKYEVGGRKSQNLILYVSGVVLVNGLFLSLQLQSSLMARGALDLVFLLFGDVFWLFEKEFAFVRDVRFKLSSVFPLIFNRVSGADLV